MKKISKVFSIFLALCLVFGIVAVVVSATEPANKTTIKNYDFETSENIPSTSNGSGAANYRSLSVVHGTANSYLRFAHKANSTSSYTTAFLVGDNNPSTSNYKSSTNLKNYDYYTVDFEIAADQCSILVGYRIVSSESSYTIEEVYKTYAKIDRNEIAEDIRSTFESFKKSIQTCIDDGLISGCSDADAFLKTTKYVLDPEAEVLASSVTVDEAIASKKLSYSDGAYIVFDNRPLIFDNGVISKVDSSGTILCLRIVINYNEDDGRWHFSIDKSSISGGGVVTDSGNEFVLADGIGEWNHFTYAVQVNHDNPAKSMVYLYYNGYLIGTSYINRKSEYHAYDETKVNIATRGFEFKINDYNSYYSMAIDNFVSTYYTHGENGYTSGDSDGIDDLFKENSRLKSVSQCSDVVYNINYVAPHPTKSADINGNQIYVPWLIDNAVESIENNSSIITHRDLLNMNPSAWVSYDIICNPDIKASLSDIAVSKGVTIEKTPLGYRVNGAEKLANMSLFNDMRFNLYLPKIDGIVIKEVAGEATLSAESVKIGGVEMYVISGTLDLERFAPMTADIKYEENGIEHQYTATLDALDYVNKVASEFKCGSDEARLVYEIIKYKEAASNYLECDLSENAKRISDFYSIFEKHENCTCKSITVDISNEEKTVDTSSIKNAGVVSLSYSVSLDTVGMVIEVDEGVEISSVTYTDKLGNEFIHTAKRGNLIKNGNCYIVDGVSAAHIDEIMTINVGEVSGSYSLGRYIEDMPGVKVAQNMYKYAVAAENYKYVSISELTVSVSKVISDGVIGGNYYVEGYCVGVSDGMISIRGINTDDSIAVHNVPDGYKVGDKIVISAKLQLDEERYLVFSDKNPDDINKTIYSRDNDVTHGHTYEGDWLEETAATIFSTGIEYRECTHDGCAVKESRVTEKLEVTGISVTSAPLKTMYDVGDIFDIMGMVVTAYDAHGMGYDITEFISLDKVILESSDKKITVSYGAFAAIVNIRVLAERITVNSLVQNGSVGSTYTVDGYFVGIANEGVYSAAPSESSSYEGDRELLIKDLETDDIIAVRDVPYGTFSAGYGYEKGDRIIIVASLAVDMDANTPNKKYLAFSVDDNPTDINETIASRGNKISYKLDNVTEISTWDEWKSFFNDENKNYYGYVKISSEMLFVDRETHSGASNAWRIHPIAAASSSSAVKSDSRWIFLNQNVMNANLGSSAWQGYFETLSSTDERYNASHCQRVCLADEVYALYTGACKNYFSLTILDEYWFCFNEDQEEESYTNADVVIEVAKAYERRDAYIQYNQTLSRRHINPSPEDATAQNMVYLDCSSFVNAVYYEAFGVNVMPYDIDYKLDGVTQIPQTGRFRNYARDNQTNADVVGYWLMSDYDDVAAILTEIKGKLAVGDVLNYRKAGDSAGHVLIYIGDNKFIHCSGDDFKDNSDASQSCDGAGSYEERSGAVSIESKYMGMFDDPTFGRYLGDAYDVCIIRPLARELTPTEKTVVRMRMQGLTADKTVDAGTSTSVYKNDTITYTVTVKNTGTGVKYFTLREILSDNVSFVSGSYNDRLTVDGKALSWDLRVGAESSITVSWTVKVNEYAKSGSLIDGSNTTLNGIGITKTVNTVSAYTVEQVTALAEKAKEYALQLKTFDNPVLMVRALYNEVLGIDIFAEDVATVNLLLEDILDLTNKCLNTESALSGMVAPYLYGGRDMANLYIKNNDIVRLITKANISVGDVIAAYDESEDRSVIYVYVGDSTLVAIDTVDNTCKTVTMSDSQYVSSHVLVTLFAYDQYVILRPSMAE